ncbi:MAG: Holliday junction branch migration protein RuvA [Thermodesulfobacteriota bacterium]
MIAHLTGRLAVKTTESVVLDVGGVGYEVFIPLSTFYDLPEPGSTVSLNVYTHLRDDAIQLYGFTTSEEKSLFQLLISVSGIGPKVARNILSGIGPEELAGAIASSDKARLSTIPGIGGKSAERLILELKDKVRRLVAPVEGSGSTGAAGDGGGVVNDVLSALDNLGYKAALSGEAVKKARTDLAAGFGFEELFKEALKHLSKK